jgi:hypothetical protein
MKTGALSKRGPTILAGGGYLAELIGVPTRLLAAGPFRFGPFGGFLEAVGMPEKPERGAIATLKSLSYDSENLIVEIVAE